MVRLLCLFALLLASPASAQTSRDYQTYFCAGWQTRVYIPEARDLADCVSPTHAIEIAPSGDFVNAIGRAVTYAASTGLKPGLILVCDSDQGNCRRYWSDAASIFQRVGVPATVWGCYPIDRALDACQRTEIGKD